MSVGANIRKIREAKGVKQSWLAEQVGISNTLLCQIERGLRNPSFQVGYEISKLLECDMTDLAEDSED